MLRCRRFFIFLVIVLLVHQTAITIFRAIGAVLRAVVLANVGAFVFIGCALLFNGYIIQQREHIHNIGFLCLNRSHNIRMPLSCCPK